MILYILRGAFIVLAASVTMLYVLPFQEDQRLNFIQVVLMLGVTLGIALGIIAADSFVQSKQRNLSAMSGIFLGLLAGLLAAWALSFVVELIKQIAAPDDEPFANLMQGLKVFIGLVTCYLSMSLVVQTKDDFRFVIPYVEFAKQIRGNRPTVLDTSVIIDGRILDVVETHVMQGTLVVPKFVLNELQTIADATDKTRRARGRRGLDILKSLQDNEIVEAVIQDEDAEGSTVDQKLVSLAQTMRARIMTNDYNLNKVATLRGVDVINMNDLAKAMRPVVLPGELMSIKVLKPGEGQGQGVGYLEDGTMVVVENGRSHMGRQLQVEVTSTLQTSAGRMIFGRPADGPEGREDERAADSKWSGASGESERPRGSGRNPRRN